MDDSVLSGCSLGLHYRLEIPGLSGADRTLSFLGASLGAHMDASRPAFLSRPLPARRSTAELAAAAAGRFADSQANYATLCALDPETYLNRAHAAFETVDPVCLRTDLFACLAGFFETQGGLFLPDSGNPFALCCSSRPTDTELLRRQLAKYLHRFFSPAIDASVELRRSRIFETARAEMMEEFLLGGPAGQIS